jgi:hypothetical protein
VNASTLVLNSPEVIKLQSTIIRALARFLEARAAVVAALRDMEPSLEFGPVQPFTAIVRRRLKPSRWRRSMPSLASALARELEAGWSSVARPNQLAPDGDWSVWLLLAGLDFG